MDAFNAYSLPAALGIFTLISGYYYYKSSNEMSSILKNVKDLDLNSYSFNAGEKVIVSGIARALPSSGKKTNSSDHVIKETTKDLITKGFKRIYRMSHGTEVVPFAVGTKQALEVVVNTPVNFTCTDSRFSLGSDRDLSALWPNNSKFWVCETEKVLKDRRFVYIRGVVEKIKNKNILRTCDIGLSIDSLVDDISAKNRMARVAFGFFVTCAAIYCFYKLAVMDRKRQNVYSCVKCLENAQSLASPCLDFYCKRCLLFSDNCGKCGRKIEDYFEIKIIN